MLQSGRELAYCLSVYHHNSTIFIRLFVPNKTLQRKMFRLFLVWYSITLLEERLCVLSLFFVYFIAGINGIIALLVSADTKITHDNNTVIFIVTLS